MTRTSSQTADDQLYPSDWSDEAIETAARDDPDARPLTEDDAKRMRSTPRVRIIRRALKLSQEAFAERFKIPVGTLRDWEQGRRTPSPAAKAYLTVIAREPEAVTRALESAP